MSIFQLHAAWIQLEKQYFSTSVAFQICFHTRQKRLLHHQQPGYWLHHKGWFTVRRAACPNKSTYVDPHSWSKLLFDGNGVLARHLTAATTLLIVVLTARQNLLSEICLRFYSQNCGYLSRLWLRTSTSSYLLIHQLLLTRSQAACRQIACGLFQLTYGLCGFIYYQLGECRTLWGEHGRGSNA